MPVHRPVVGAVEDQEGRLDLLRLMQRRLAVIERRVVEVADAHAHLADLDNPLLHRAAALVQLAIEADQVGDRCAGHDRLEHVGLRENERRLEPPQLCTAGDPRRIRVAQPITSARRW